MSEIEFINDPVANPNYLKNQRNVIDNIKAQPYLEIIPNEYQKSIDKYLLPNSIREETISLNEDEDTEIVFKKTENDILTIKKIQRPFKIKKSESNSLQTRILSKIIPNIGVIEDFFIIDLKSKMALDTKLFCNTKSSTKHSDKEGETVLITYPNKKIIGGFVQNNEGGEIIINQINEKIKDGLLSIEKLSPTQIDLCEIAVIFHESGHHFQHDQYENEDPQIKKQFRLVNFSRIPFLSYLFSDKTIKSLEKLKIHTAEKERNATAFSLSVMRKLKQQGIDLTRGLTNQEVISAICIGLKSYEELFKNIDGPKIFKK